MKKKYLAMAALACSMSMNAQSIKVYKGTEVVKTYLSGEADSVVFSGAETPKTRLSPSVTDPAKVQMLNSLQSLDGNRLYVMNYTCDYKLDELLDAGTDNYIDLFAKGGKLLFDNQNAAKPANPMKFGCSAYAATGTAGNYFMGRNFDFVHQVADATTGKTVEAPTSVVIVLTSPTNGFKSINVIDPMFLGLKNGFYDDPNQDISNLMFAPFDTFDGVNEKGLAICDLFLDGDYANQTESGKKNIFATVAMRGVLDKCSTIEEAIAFLQKYNMKMDGAVGGHGNGSLHFYMADADGGYAIVEYSFEDPSDVTVETVPTRFTVMKGDDAYRYMTNFYVDPRLKDCQYGGLSQHGRDRYNVLQATIQAYKNTLTDVRAKSLLESVSQTSDPKDATSHTQWSSLYDLTNKTLEISILQEYGNWYKFSLK